MTNSLKITCISDTHTYHHQLDLPGGDILIHAGDISYTGQPTEVADFIGWFSEQPYKYKIFIAGNHDFGFEPKAYGKKCEKDGTFYFRGATLKKGLQQDYRRLCKKFGVIYLQDKSITIEGYKIYGSPWTPEFCDWAFNYKKFNTIKFSDIYLKSDCYKTPHAEEVWARIPDDTDILITHGPPLGVLDVGSDMRLGCSYLAERVNQLDLTAHIFGHIHESHGTKHTGKMISVNASICGIPYDTLQEPISILVPRKK